MRKFFVNCHRSLESAEATPPARRNLAARLRFDANGAVALEFAMIAIPFFALLFIVLNSAFMMFCNAVVQGAVATAARQIQTGQFQNTDTNCPPTSNSALTQFESSVCAGTMGQLPCGNIIYDVRTFASFSAISLPAPGGSTQYCFNTGGTGAIVAVRVIYNWPTLVQPLTALLGAPNSTQIQYTIITKNEPF